MMPNVLLLSMPFGALEWPALGLGLLQAALTRRGVRCETRYLTFDFADFVGADEYRWICHDVPYAAFAGDWTFAAQLHGEDPSRDADFVKDVLQARWGMGHEEIARVLRVRAYAGHFLDHCLSTIDWASYEVVGFTSTFQQNIASLALARRIKNANPQVSIVFGGANWEGEMGLALHRRFPFVDLVCSGEADVSFPELVEVLGDGRGDVVGRHNSAVAAISGIVYRSADGGSVVNSAPSAIRDLDTLPVPDFEPYFRDLQASTSAVDTTPMLLVETARGCWWGTKHHCRFCGLNGATLAFRSKSADRVLSEVRELHDRHGIATFSVVDNILDMRYFESLLPRLASDPRGLRFSWEVKGNLTRDQVRLLAEARVDTIQPGIESLSDRLLTLMDKGTTMLRNVALLKWCRQYGVTPAWNLLFGFPGERAEDYTGQVDVIARIGCLDPPSGIGPVRLDRFSPYFETPEEYGLVNVRPMEPYRFLYPGPEEELAEIASYFDYDYADGRDPWSYVRTAIEAVRRWQANGPQGGVWLVDGQDGGVTVVQDRPGGPRRRAVLSGWKAAAFLACDEARRPAALLREAALREVALDQLVAFLDGCVQAGLMLEANGAYLSLAIETCTRRTTRPGARPEPETSPRTDEMLSGEHDLRTGPMEDDPVLAVEVVMRPARGGRVTDTAQITAMTIEAYRPATEAVAQAAGFFRAQGLAVSRLHGLSFTISGPQSAIERLFGSPIRVSQRAASLVATTEAGQLELPLDSLPPHVAGLLEAVTFSAPPDYGPSAP